MRAYPKFKRFHPLLLCLLFIIGASCSALALNISGPLTINTDNAATYTNKDIVVTSGIVTIDTQLTINSLILQNGAVITHTAGSIAGLQLTVTNDANINAGGAINLNGQGYPGSHGPGAGQDYPGTGFGYSGGRASYGGEGLAGPAAFGAVYGSIKSPKDLGSGGGSTSNGRAPGAPGGGAVQLIVGGTLTVDGAITANGQDGSSYGGSGSGGSILLQVFTLTGSGTINANGGVFAGGGRIAISYTVLNIQLKNSDGTSQIGALGKGDYFSSTNYGGAGTVWVHGPANSPDGDLWISNNGKSGVGTTLPYSPSPNAYTFDNVIIWGGARLTPEAYPRPLVDNALKINVLHDMVVDRNGWVDATGRGFSTGEGLGAGQNNTGSGGGGGASYGGEGGFGYHGSQPAGGATYGDAKNPIDLGGGENLGSGGGSGNSGIYLGGAGGGAIRITVGGTLTVDGTIAADGMYGRDGGAGSGGSIILDVGSLSTTTNNNSGTIRANGGSSNSYGGGGGGGRIVVHYSATNNIPRGSIQASGGSSFYSANAAAGTVVVKGPGQLYGELRINNTVNNNVDVHTRTNATILAHPVIFDQNTFDQVTIGSNGVLAPAMGDSLNLIVKGNMTLESGGIVSALARGNIPGYGKGAGASTLESFGTAGGAGGSYGGRGNSGLGGNAPPSGPLYGDTRQPLDLGSGGGRGISNSTYYFDGYGGGAIHLTVYGTLQVDGLITANANKASIGAGGGAGGSILLQSYTLAGTGSITANGGDNGGTGGGGGGGRIALYSGTKTLSDSKITVNGGTDGTLTAAAGTLYEDGFTGLTISTLQINNTKIQAGQTAVFTINLTASAPPGGALVNLANSDPTVVDIPATVMVPAGTNMASFTVTAKAATIVHSTTVTGYLGGTSAAATLTVTPILTNTSLTTYNAAGVPGQTVNITCRMFSDSIHTVANELVNFVINKISIGTAVTDSKGFGVLPYKITDTIGAGPVTFTINFTGDDLYNASTNTGTLTVSKANTSLVLNNVSASAGQIISIPVRLSGQFGNLISGRKISLNVNGTATGYILTQANGIGTFSYQMPTNIAPGTYSVSASFPGDPVYNPSTITSTLTIVKANTLLSAFNQTVFPGQPISLQCRLLNQLNQAAAGKTVTFSLNGSVLGTAVTDSRGFGVFSLIAPDSIGIGPKAISVSFAGDDTYNSSLGSGTLTIIKTNSSLVMTNATITAGQTLKQPVRLLGSFGNYISGRTIALKVNGIAAGTAVTASNGVGGFIYVVPAGTAPGTYTMTASFAGDSVYNSSIFNSTITVK